MERAITVTPVVHVPAKLCKKNIISPYLDSYLLESIQIWTVGTLQSCFFSMTLGHRAHARVGLKINARCKILVHLYASFYVFTPGQSLI